MKKTSSTFASLGLFILVLVVWQTFSNSSARLNFLFGSPLEIFMALVQETTGGLLINDFFVTGYETLVGFVCGVTSGTFAGFLLWYSPFVARIFKPYIVILNALPVFAFAPLVIVWFGIGLGMKIAMATLGAFLVALAQAYEGARNVKLEKFRLLKTFGATRWKILVKIIFPSSLTWVLASMKLSVGAALLGAFIGEFISSDRGLGHFMLRAGSLYDIPLVFAGGVYLVMLALLLQSLVTFLEKSQMTILGVFSVDKAVRQQEGRCWNGRV